MSWNKLAPIAKSTGRPMVSATVTVNKAGEAKLSVILSSSIHDEFGARTKVDVSAGEGDHADSLLIEFDLEGAFDVKPFSKGGGRIFVPLPDGVPHRACENLPCILGERSNDSLVIKLPIAAWTRARGASAPLGGGAPALAPKPTGVGNGALVDMVEYLTAKGVKVSRLGDGKFAMDGVSVSTATVLRVVNEKRRAGDLDPLPHSKVW